MVYDCSSRYILQLLRGKVSYTGVSLNSSKFIKQILKNKMLLPPMVGYTDYPYRRILASFNPPFICTEMISPYAILNKNMRTIQMLRKIEGSHINGVQLIGEKRKIMSEAAEYVEGLGFDYIDINMGCTVKAIALQGAGISLMKDEEKAVKLASAILQKVNIPVTCKMRLGLSDRTLNAVSLSRKLEEAGIAAITVHGRTGESKFGLPLDYEGIRDVVETCNIPIIANGGINSGLDAIKVLQLTGAKAIMPGRGLIGNPWLIPEILSSLEEREYQIPSLQERKQICLLHLQYLCEFYGKPKGIIMMRRIYSKYFSKCKHLVSLKIDSQSIKTFEEFRKLQDHIQKDEYGLHYTKKIDNTTSYSGRGFTG